jgi:ABC-2 type transport system permease protein
MIGTLRMASAVTRQLLRSSEIFSTMVVFPGALLVVLALFSNLRWESSEGAVPLMDFWITGMGVLAVALGNGHAFLATMANYKAGGVLKRISVTPISPAHFILGELLPRTVMGIVTFVGFLLVGRALGAGIRLQVGVIDVVPVIMMIIFTGLAIAFAIAGLTSTPQNANALDSSLNFLLYLFTGAMFPLAAFPGWLEDLARFLPYTGRIVTVRGIAIHRQRLADFGPELAIAGAWIALLLLSATRAYRFVK